MSDQVCLKGTFRFYYNVASEWPLVASVDQGPGTTEIKLIGVTCHVPCWSVFGGPLNDLQPRFWMECYGTFRCMPGRAGVFTRE